MKKESYIIGCVRRLREYGEGMLFADQAISSILDVVKANVYTTICMSQTSQRDRRECISVLGLNPQQAELTNYLETGQGIIRLAGRYPLPQLLDFPFIKPRNISEKELDEINAKDGRVRKLLSRVKVVNQKQGEQVVEEVSEEKAEKQIDEGVRRMLVDIADYFDETSTQRAKRLGLSGSASDKVFKTIEREQLAEVIRLNLSGSRGGMSKYYALTKKGYEAISEKPPKQSGGTGATHFFLERYLEKHLSEKGFSDLEIEKNIGGVGGKRIDLWGKYDGLSVGIEICCSTMKTEHINVQKDIDKCDALVVVAPDKKTKGKLETALYQKIEQDPKLKTCVVHELLNAPENIISN